MLIVCEKKGGLHGDPSYPAGPGGPHTAGDFKPAETRQEVCGNGNFQKKIPRFAAAISRHLSVLKEADLIRDQREGKYIFYELNTSVLEEIMIWFSELKGGKEDE